MKNNNNTRPIVLVFSGHDPSGGAGIQADMESIAACGAFSCAVITCLTVQDSINIKKIYNTDPTIIKEQIEALLADVHIDAIKIGLLGNIENIHLIRDTIRSLPGIPVILDPVLKSGGGTDLADQQLIEAIKKDLLPKVTLLTPNRHEARLLSGEATPKMAANRLLALGCNNVLVTGADESKGQSVENTLYNKHGERTYTWPLLEGHYHGSGCTLAASCAAQIAQGKQIVDSILTAQKYTMTTLENAIKIGKGQKIPSRIKKTCH